MKSSFILIRSGSFAVIVLIELCAAQFATAQTGTGAAPAGAPPGGMQPSGSPPYGTPPPGQTPIPGTAPNGYSPYGRGPYSNSVQPGFTNNYPAPPNALTNAPGFQGSLNPNRFVPSGNGLYRYGTNEGFMRGTNGFYRHHYRNLPDVFVPDRDDMRYENINGVFQPVDRDDTRGIYRNGILYPATNDMPEP